MRTAPLTALVAGLAMGAPATAQTPRQPTRSSSPETFVAVLTGAYAVPEVDTRATGTAVDKARGYTTSSTSTRFATSPAPTSISVAPGKRRRPSPICSMA